MLLRKALGVDFGDDNEDDDDDETGLPMTVVAADRKCLLVVATHAAYISSQPRPSHPADKRLSCIQVPRSCNPQPQACPTRDFQLPGKVKPKFPFDLIPGCLDAPA